MAETTEHETMVSRVDRWPLQSYFYYEAVSTSPGRRSSGAVAVSLPDMKRRPWVVEDFHHLLWRIREPMYASRADGEGC